MTPEEIFHLLTQKVAPRDGRTVGKVDVAIWHEDIGDLDFGDACEAVARHFRQSSGWLMPVHVRELVKAIRSERLANSDHVIPAADPDDPAAYIAALRANLRDLADGRPPLRAIDAGPDVEPAGNAAVEKILAEFNAKRAAAEERRRAELAAERAALRAYIDAQETLLALDDLGASFLVDAQETLYSTEQAAADFPLAAGTLGITDQQKTTVFAARLAAGQA